jgi:hypothetical protein
VYFTVQSCRNEGRDDQRRDTKGWTGGEGKQDEGDRTEAREIEPCCKVSEEGIKHGKRSMKQREAKEERYLPQSSPGARRDSAAGTR